MEFMLIAAGAIAILAISALTPSDRRDAIRDATGGCLSGQLFPAPRSCG